MHGTFIESTPQENFQINEQIHIYKAIKVKILFYETKQLSLRKIENTGKYKKTSPAKTPLLTEGGPTKSKGTLVSLPSPAPKKSHHTSFMFVLIH